MHLHAHFSQVILFSNSMHHINNVSFTAKFVYRFCKLDTQLGTRLDSQQPKTTIRNDHSYFLAVEF